MDKVRGKMIKAIGVRYPILIEAGNGYIGNGWEEYTWPETEAPDGEWDAKAFLAGVYVPPASGGLVLRPRIEDGGNRYPVPFNPARILAAAPYTTDDETRYFLNGVNIEWETELVAATDGRRLYVSTECPMVKEELDRPDIIIRPTKAFLAATKEPGTYSFIVCHSRSSCTFSLAVGLDVYHAKCIEGQFPNFRRALPDSPRVSVPLPSSEFLAKCKAVAGRHDKRIHFGDGRWSNDEGTVTEGATVNTGYKISINREYLADAIAGGAKEILADAESGEKAVKLMLNDGAVAVIMPMQRD